MSNKTFILLLIAAAIVGYAVMSAPVSKIAGDVGNNVYFAKTASSSVSAVSGTSVKVLSANEGRRWAICSNVGAANVFLAFSTGASKSWGILMPASSSFQIAEPTNLYVGPVYAITNGASTRVSCVEDR